MFTGRFEGTTLSTTAYETPSTWETAADAFKFHYVTPLTLLPMEDEKRNAVHESLETMQQIANAGDQGLGQKSATWFAGFMGSVLNPLSLATGEAGGIIANRAISGAAGLVGRYAPFEAAVLGTAVAQKRIGSLIGENVPDFVAKQTVGSLTRGAAQGFAIGTGFSLPERIAETYDPAQHTFNWWGGVKASFADGGIGLALMAVPFAAGTIWGKIRGRATEELPLSGVGKTPSGEVIHPSVQQIEQAAQAGRISAEEAQFMHDYVGGKVTNEELNSRAVALLVRDGHAIDQSTKSVLFNIFKPEEIEQIQTALADELAHGQNAKQFSEYLLNSKIDEFKSKVGTLDGLEGVISYLRKRMELKPAEISNFKKMMKEILPSNGKVKNPFHQTKIYNAIKAGRDLGNIIVPRQVIKRLTHDTKVAGLIERGKRYQRLLEQTGLPKWSKLIKENQSKLDDLMTKEPELLSHNKELDFIKSRLVKDGEVVAGYKTKREYERLMDLAKSEEGSRIRNSSLQLAHELNLLHEYQMQRHYATFLEAVTKVMRSSVANLADHNRLIDYLKQRVIREVPDNARNAEINTVEMNENIRREEGAAEETIQQLDNEMRDAPEEVANQYTQLKKQFNELKNNKGIFSALVKCQEGLK